MKSNPIFAGVDIGSTTSKAVLIDSNEDILGFAIIDTQHDRNASGEAVFQSVLKAAGKTKEDISCVYSTGYGRKAFKYSDRAFPEIICHAHGTVNLYPDVRTIIDIGGQDSKIISLDAAGIASKFEMNDKCAAGTGRFFEVLSNRLLNVPLDELGMLALKSKNPCQISSTCTVFAESEIVSYLSQGILIEDVAMGVLESIARRVWAMGSQTRMPFNPAIVVTGGLARNVALKRALKEKFKKEIETIENPQLPAALGAALIAKNEYAGS